MSIRCPKCTTSYSYSNSGPRPVKYGFFRRRSDRKWIQRYRCGICAKHFSAGTTDPCYRQNKRHLNQTIFEHLASGVSQRRLAYLLRINRKTVKRKFILLGREALLELRRLNLMLPRAQIIEFDDLETFEHSKCKPLSVTLAVEHGSRRMLGFSVSVMPAKGRLTMKAMRKYGPRPDERPRGRKLLLSALKGLVVEPTIIKSDQNPHYSSDVEKFFPNSVHLAFKGRRGADTGQGELKKTVFDPLFSLNHTCAKLRADINRLIRKTWCTTKRIECLRYHIALYTVYHNVSLYSPKRV